MGNEVSVEEKNADVEMGSSTNVNPQQLEILKKVVVALGKKPEEVDEFIHRSMNTRRIRKKVDAQGIKTNENG